MAFKSNNRYSLGFQNQSDYTTFPAIGSAGDWAWLDLVEPPAITYARQLEQRPDAPTGSAGAERPPLPGSRHGGTITFRLQATSMASGYASPTVPVFNVDPVSSSNPHFNLLATFLTGTDIGARSSANDLSATGNDANTLETDAGPTVSPKPGVGYLHTKDGAGDLQWVVVKSQSGTTIELLEDYAGIVTDMDSALLIPSITFSPESAPSPTFHTFLLEEGLTLSRILYGAFHQSSTLTFNPGETPIWEHTFGFTAHKKITGGPGIQPATEYNVVPAPMDINNGRFNLGGPQDADGTYDSGDYACINELSITFTTSADAVKCHGHAGGSFQDVSNVVTTDLEVRVTMSITHSDTYDDSSGNDDTVWDDYLDNQTARGITVYTGNTEGKCMALVIPAGHLVDQPQEVNVGDALVGHTLTWAPGAWTSDDAGDAGDTAVRVMLA